MARPRVSDPALRRFALACSIGGGLSILIFAWSLWSAPGPLLDKPPHGWGGFYDQQARALFQGHWYSDNPRAFFIERINVDGEYYMYFGPWPAFLRMPILALTGRLDEQLTRPSLLLAHLVWTVGVSRLAWQVRSLVRRTVPSRREAVAVAAFVLAVGSGTGLVLLSSLAIVYDEALLWGAAWSIWSLSFALAHLVAPTRWTLALAAMAATFAISCRVSFGLAGVAVLGTFAVVQLLTGRGNPRLQGVGRTVARIVGVDDRLDGRGPWSTAAAAAAPVVALLAVNWLKFGSLLSIPFDKQDAVLLPQRHELLARNGSRILSADSIPTNVVNYLRPNAISLGSEHPFVGFSSDVVVIGDPARDIEQPFTSITSSATFVVVLALVGLAAVLVGRVARAAGLEDVRALRVLAFGACLGVLPMLVFPSVAQRYTVDMLPALVLLGAVGVYAVASIVRGRALLRSVVAVLAALLLAANVWTNVALTFDHRTTVDHRAMVVRWDSTTELPPPAPTWSLLIVDDCAGVMLSDGTQWAQLPFEDPGPLCEVAVGG